MLDGKITRSTPAEIAHLIQVGDVPEEEADIVAAGYETTCPHCHLENRLIEVPSYGDDLVECGACRRRFVTALPEHAYQ